MCLYADQISQQCSQHQAGRAEFSFFDLGTGVLLELVLAETALELWWVELIGLEPAGVDNRRVFSYKRFFI